MPAVRRAEVPIRGVRPSERGRRSGRSPRRSSGGPTRRRRRRRLGMMRLGLAVPLRGRGRRAREVGTVAAFAALSCAAVAGAGGPAGAAAEVTRALDLLVRNHLPGVGGVVEDSFLGLLAACTVYCLWRSSVIPRPVGNPITRRSRTNASWVHVLSGAGALATGLYGVVLERVCESLRLDVDVGELGALPHKRAHLRAADADLQGFQGGKYAMQLGYSFVASFQGWCSSRGPRSRTRPTGCTGPSCSFWYFSIAKLWESTEFRPRARARRRGGRLPGQRDRR